MRDSRKARAALAIPAAAILAALVFVPAQLTDASFTDLEAGSADMSAASLGTITTTCATPGAGTRTTLVVEWSLAGATMPATSFDIFLAPQGGEAIRTTVAGAIRTASFGIDDKRFSRDTAYTIAVVARSSSAANWSSTSAVPLVAVKGHPKGWESCL
jgi:hypothetical protein